MIQWGSLLLKYVVVWVFLRWQKLEISSNDLSSRPLQDSDRDGIKFYILTFERLWVDGIEKKALPVPFFCKGHFCMSDCFLSNRHFTLDQIFLPYFYWPVIISSIRSLINSFFFWLWSRVLNLFNFNNNVINKTYIYNEIKRK